MQPNLLFIMTDQQRFDALGANGNNGIRTPNLDRLAAGGVNVQQYFSNCPVCVPSRVTLFTGRYPHSHRVRENHNFLEAGREIHLFRVLKKAGYSIGYVGKNHLLEDPEFVNFNYADVWGHNHQAGPAEQEVAHFGRSRGAVMREVACWAGATFHDYPPESTVPYVKASSAMRFLQERPQDRPFCLCLSFSDPHAPHIALRKYEKVYPLEEMALHPVCEGELDEKASRFPVKYRAQGSHLASEQDKRRFMAVYYSMISWVDEQIGRVLGKLDELGLRENTIVVFTSDHGEFCFEHGMCKKDLVLLDSLLHVPLVISWPGQLEPARIAHTFMEEVDVMPTLLDLMGVAAPYGVQGASIMPVVRGEAASHKEAVYGEICPPWLYNPFPDYESFLEDWRRHGQGPPPFNIPGDFNKMIRTRECKYHLVQQRRGGTLRPAHGPAGVAQPGRRPGPRGAEDQHEDAPAGVERADRGPARSALDPPASAAIRRLGHGLGRPGRNGGAGLVGPALQAAAPHSAVGQDSLRRTRWR